MIQAKKAPNWIAEFQIHSASELDFVIAQNFWPIGMTRSSTPEFRRRVLAATMSYQLQLRSIDYALRRYVDPNEYESDEISIGDMVSDFLKDSVTRLEADLRNLHYSEGSTFGQFGAELTLFKFPYTMDLARMLANRGLFLEVLPILRLCLEMISWAAVAFHIDDEGKVRQLKAQKCIPKIKPIYESAGKVYGYLSKLSHWEQAIHSHFLNFEGEKVSVIRASCQHRAMSLTLRLIILDIFVEVIRNIYSTRGETLIINVQEVPERTDARKIHQIVSDIVGFSGLDDFRELKSLLR